jgi:hypothetical protein
MKKFLFIGFFMLFLSQQQAFAQQEQSGTMLLKRLQEINGHLTDIKIELAEIIIDRLEAGGDYVQIESLKSIYRIASEYINFCDCEQRVLLLYPYINEKAKVYVAGHLRDLLQKKQTDLNESMKNFQNYNSYLKNKDTILKVAQLKKRIEEAQDLINQLIKFYSSENKKYQGDKE